MAITVVGTGVSGTSGNGFVPNVVVSLPSGIQTDDVAYIAVYSKRASAPQPDLTTPSGWTLVQGPINTTTTTAKSYLYMKQVGPADSGTSVTFVPTGGSQVQAAGVAIVLRGAVATANAIATPYTATGTTNFQYPAVTPTVNDALHVAFLAWGNNSANTVGTGWTEHAEAVNYTVASAAVHTKQASGGANTSTGTDAWTIASANAGVAFRMAFEPAVVSVSQTVDVPTVTSTIQSIEATFFSPDAKFDVPTVTSTAQAVEPAVSINATTDVATAGMSAAAPEATVTTRVIKTVDIAPYSDFGVGSTGTVSEQTNGTILTNATRKALFLYNIPSDYQQAGLVKAEFGVALYSGSGDHMEYRSLITGLNTSNYYNSVTAGEVAEGLSFSKTYTDFTASFDAATFDGFMIRTTGGGNATVVANEYGTANVRPTLRLTYEVLPLGADLTLDTPTASLVSNEATIQTIDPVSIDMTMSTLNVSAIAVDPEVSINSAIDLSASTASLDAYESTVETVVSPDVTLEMTTALVVIPEPVFSVGAGAVVDAENTNTVMLGSYDPEVVMTQKVIVDLDTPRTIIQRIPVTDVNGEPVAASESEDRYFVATMNTLVGVQRGFSGGSTIDDKDTPVSAERQTWFRLNETSGDRAYDRLQTPGVAKENQPQLLLSNVTIGQKVGPEGRHNFSLNGDAYMKAYIEEGAVKESGIEFTFRTTKQTQFLMGNADEYGNLSTQQGDEWELWIVNGKLEIRRWPWINTFSGAYRTAKEVITGNKFVSDGQWHHVVLQSGYATWLLNNANRFNPDNWGMELHIDGNLDVRRRVPSIAVAGFPDFIGGRPTPFYDNIRASEDVPRSQWFEGELTEIVYRSGRILSPDEIALQRDTMMGIFPYYGEAPKITANGGEAITRGNKPRMLVLNFGAPEDIRERLVEFSVEPLARSIYEKHPATLGRPYDRIALAFVGLGENTTHYRMMEKDKWPDVDYLKFYEFVTAPQGYRTFRKDAVTDNYRLLDLDIDLNMDDYDVIAISAFPGNEAQMKHYDIIDSENVEPMIPARKQLENLLGQIKDQVRFHGKGLFVADPFSAVKMGLIDQVDVVPDYYEFAPAGSQQSQLGGVYPGFDGHAYTTDPFGGYRPQSRPDANGIPQTDWAAYDDREKSAASRIRAAARYTDTHSNIYQTVRTVVEGLTTYPGYVKTDEIRWWNLNPMNEPPYHVSIRFEDKRAGLGVGDTFLIDSPVYDEDTLDTFEDDATRKHLFYRVAAPMSAIRAGSAVTSYARTMRVGTTEAVNRNESLPGNPTPRPNDIIGNPFGDHAIAIAVQPGDVWDGVPVSGKVYVNFTESLQFMAERVPTAPRMAWEHLDPEVPPGQALKIGEEFRFSSGESFQVTPDMARYQFSTHFGSNAGSEIPLPPGSNPDWGWSAGGTRGSGMSGGGAYAIAWNWKPGAQLISLPIPTMSNRALKWLALDLDMDGEVRVNTETVNVTAKANDVTVETTSDVEIDLSTARVNVESYVDKDTVASDVSVLAGTAAVVLRAQGLVNVVDLDTPTVGIHSNEPENTVLDELDWTETILLTMPRQIITLTLEEN